MLAHESRRAAEEETDRQTQMLMDEIEAHKRTDAALQKAKEVAEAANVAKTRYIVGVSHEIRTPLNSIFGYAQLLERGRRCRRPADAIRVIRRSAEHLANLVDGLLDISKIENGRLRLNRDKVAHRRVPRPDRRHVPPAGRGQGHRVPLRAAGQPAAPMSIPTRSGCGRS